MRAPAQLDRAAVPADILAELRWRCLALPEVAEEPAWAGTRWSVGGKNFAHVLRVDNGWPPAYARVAGIKGPACVLTFRSWRVEVDPEHFERRPFFRPRWWPDIAGIVLDAASDWREVSSLIEESYRHLAPKRLAALAAQTAGRRGRRDNRDCATLARRLGRCTHRVASAGTGEASHVGKLHSAFARRAKRSCNRWARRRATRLLFAQGGRAQSVLCLSRGPGKGCCFCSSLGRRGSACPQRGGRRLACLCHRQ